MAERSDHFQAQRRGLDHHRRAHPVQYFVPLDRSPDVLHVVQAIEVGARHPRVGVIEAGRHDQLVVADLALAVDGRGLPLGADGGDPFLILDVDALTSVSFFGCQKQPLEVGYLFAVDIGNTTRAVSDIFEFCKDADVCRGVHAFGGPGSANARGASADHYDPLRHRHPLPMSRDETFSIGYESYTILARAVVNVKTRSSPNPADSR